MNNRFVKIFFMAAVLSLVSKTSGAFGFIGGGTSTLDAVTDAGQTTVNIGTTLKTGFTTYTKKIQSNIELLKSKYEQYKNDYIGVMNGENKPPLNGTRTIEDSSLAKADDPVAIQKAVYDLFMTYPSRDKAVQNKCDQKISQFYIDTMIELNTAAIKLEEKFNSELQEKVDNMPTDILSGENGAEVGDSENAGWKNKYNVYKTLDDLMQMYEELVAMEAQFIAAKAMRNEIPKLEPMPDGTYRQSSLNQQREQIQLAEYQTPLYKSTMAFGQLMSGNEVSQEESLDDILNNMGLTEKQEEYYQPTESYENRNISDSDAEEGVPETDASKYKFRYDAASQSNVSFMDMPSSDEGSPYSENQEAIEDLAAIDPTYHKILAAIQVHNMIQGLPTKRDIFNKYHQYEKLHEKLVERVKTSDQCVMNFIGRYYKEPEKTWYGDVYIGDQITDYDLREGLSRWAIDSYETAKSEKVDGVDKENFAEMEINPDIMTTESYVNTSEQEEEVKSQVEEKNFSGHKTKTKEENTNESEREISLLAWNIGSEATEMLAKDQYLEEPQWGEVINKFPVWTDQKNFYGQYIDGKYDNMKKVVERMDLRAIGVQIAMYLNDKSNASKLVKKIINNQLSSMYASLKNNPILEESTQEDDFTIIAGEKKEAIEELDKNFQKILAQMAEGRKVTVTELDLEQETKNNLSSDLNSGQIEGRTEEIIDETVDIEGTKEDIKTQNEKIAEKTTELDNIDAKILEYQKEYIRKEQKIEQQYAQALGNIARPLSKKLEGTLNAGIGGEITQEILNLAMPRFVSLISEANGITTDIKNYAIEEIEKARTDIYAIGDEIYLTSGGEKVLERHKELIDSLRGISLNQIAKQKDNVKQIIDWSEGASIVNQIFTSALIGQICEDNKCTEADEDYFVSMNGKFRDFVGPKAAPETTTAPAREVVYLDYIDYNNIPKLADGSISKKGLQEYGHKIPQVWQYMLKNPAYVEKDIDLESALSVDKEDLYFLRGGNLPCHYNGTYGIDADVDKKMYTIFQNNKDYGLLACTGLTITQARVKDLELEKNDTQVPSLSSGLQSGDKSELGTFMTYEDNKFMYRPLAKESYDLATRIYVEQDEEYEDNIKDSLLLKGEYTKNQIGDFLEFMDMEQEAKQKLDEMENKIQETKEELIEELSNAGFSVSEDLDLTDEKEYTSIVEKLDELKATWIKSAEEDLSKIKTQGNVVVEDRLAILRNLLLALQLDNKELLTISEATQADSSFEEDLKEEETNRAAANEYQKQADEEFEKQMNTLPAPYCATY